MTKNNAPLILRMLQKITTKTLYKAISILLHPCCTPTITNVDVSCNDDDTYLVVITFAESINLLGKGTYTLLLNGTNVITGDFTDGNTLTINSLSSVVGNTYTVSVLFKLPTSFNKKTGVYLNSNDALNIVFPAC